LSCWHRGHCIPSLQAARSVSRAEERVESSWWNRWWSRNASARSAAVRGEAPPESAWSRLHQRPESLHESEIVLWLWADGAVDRGVEKELGCAHLTHPRDIFLDLLQGPTEDRATGAEWLDLDGDGAPEIVSRGPYGLTSYVLDDGRTPLPGRGFGPPRDAGQLAVTAV